MAATTTELSRIGLGHEEDEEEHYVDHGDGQHGVVEREVGKRLAVEGGHLADDKAGGDRGRADYDEIGGGGVRSFEKREGGGRALPPPHAWLAIEDAKKQRYDSDPEEQWAPLLRGGGREPQQRRSSCSVVQRERAAREVCLDRAWEMKRNWHECNGGGGVAMDVEEVRACRDLGLELPPDCTVEIQCCGGSSPSRTAGTDSAPCSISSPGADPTDVKARLKVWAQAVASSTTHLGS